MQRFGIPAKCVGVLLAYRLAQDPWRRLGLSSVEVLLVPERGVSMIFLDQTFPSVRYRLLNPVPDDYVYLRPNFVSF